VLAAQGTRLSPGDIVLVRTGWRRKYLTDGDKSGFLDTEPGIGLSCCQWLKDHDVAAIASDNWAVEAIPGEVADEVFPVHMVAIRDMGMVIGEMFDLESLASDCASDGVFEFMLCAPVLKFTGGTGTPLNPLAIK
jgi:kynurenine formamidase